MPYIARDQLQCIAAVYSEPRPDAPEWLAEDDPQLLTFLAGSEQARGLLSQLDSDMVRVVEDLIDLLIQKKLILPTELPDAVQRKLEGRQRLRRQLSAHNPVLGEDDII